MKNWLFNPARYIAGEQSLGMGWAIMLATAVICYFSKTHFDGVLDVHQKNITTPILYHILEAAINWLSITIALYASGVIFSKSSIRLIDVAGTQAMARWPLILAAIFGFGINTKMPIHTIEDVHRILSPSMILFSLLNVIAVIWMVAVQYNSFAVACNLKGKQATILFIGGIVIAEIISKAVFYYLIIF